MKMRTLVVAVVVAAGGAAQAQPTEPPPGGEPTPPNPTPPNPTPPNPMPPNPVPVQPQPVMPAPPAEEPARPPEFSVGIGVGYIFPTSLQTPNVASVRFRLPTGLTFEPRVALASTKDTVDTGTPVDNKTTEIGVGTVIRVPMMMRGKFDLELLGSLDIDQVTQDPAMDDNNTTTTRLNLDYGLAVNMWVTRHWNLSFSATNPVVSFTRVRQEMGPMNVLVTSETTIGAIFDPTVTVMLHIFY